MQSGLGHPPSEGWRWIDLSSGEPWEKARACGLGGDETRVRKWTASGQCLEEEGTRGGLIVGPLQSHLVEVEGQLGEVGTPGQLEWVPESGGHHEGVAGGD